MAHIFIGLSGYSYKPWQGPGRFYPEGLKSSEFLRYYATRYRTVELDGVWYRLPTEQTVRSWIEQTLSTFLFAPKAHHQITHMSRLKPEALSFAQIMLDRLARWLRAGVLARSCCNCRRTCDATTLVLPISSASCRRAFAGPSSFATTRGAWPR